MLPEIVRACRGTKVEIYFDGGVRRGTDVFKALAMGAKAVFVGRPVLWGLAYRVSLQYSSRLATYEMFLFLGGREWSQAGAESPATRVPTYHGASRYVNTQPVGASHPTNGVNHQLCF